MGQGQSEASPPSLPEHLAPLGCYRTHREASERGLVVLSMRHPYWVFQHESGFLLCVEKSLAPAAQEQLRLYEQEHRPDRTPAAPMPASPSLLPAFTYALVLTLFFLSQQVEPFLLETGRMDGQGVLVRTETPRLLTSLFLHADFVHLLSNVASGACFSYAASTLFGVGLTWNLFLLSGAAASLSTAWTHAPAPYYAIGASGAIFGLLGAMSSAAILRRLTPHGTTPSLRSLSAPLFAGLGLLAMLGGGDARVDILAHVHGFVAGAVLGLLFSRIPRPTGRTEAVLVGLALAAVALAWSLARFAHGTAP